MATLRPWYTVVTPREDLREGRPMDASEFAVHLDQVRDGRAPAVYQRPEQFFERTYLTRNLKGLAAEVLRRLAGETTEASAVFNMATQFGGGKTHALTLLYHLATHGPEASGWKGVEGLVQAAGLRSAPRAATAVFVGTEFDPIAGRGGEDGTPVRRTPWGEIAYQLGGEAALGLVAEHERQGVAPGGDVIRQLLPEDRPYLILLDELMNYVSRTRRSGLAAQLYTFLQNLSETARGQRGTVLVVSIPASELEMTAEDQADYDRLKKLLDRIGKPVIMSAEAETSEIIRRRLFEWGGLPQEGKKAVAAYADWVIEHRQQLPAWFPVDGAREAFAATYPFHPMALSVFERKWQELPRFQQTRGVLRLLALWVARAYQEGYQGAHRDPLIGLGTAPLEDSLFRTALFEQLGETRLEGAVTTDIAGKADSHAVRLDKEAVETIKRLRLHRKVATAIFFESNGGQGQPRQYATEPEVRLAVAEPNLDIGNVETVRDALLSSCYYLVAEGHQYRFQVKPNLNKVLSDRRATIQSTQVEARVQEEVREVFKRGSGAERFYFPARSNDVPDRAALALVVLAPGQSLRETRTLELIGAMTREHGASARTFKSALIWAVAERDDQLREEARNALAWEDIRGDGTLNLDESQRTQANEQWQRSKRDLRESVWRAYKYVVLLGKDNQLRTIDLGLVHSSAADSLTALILNRLRQDGDLEEAISPNFLVRNWPPAFKEWSTKGVRDAFYASPALPRLTRAEVLTETIAKGVANGILAYVGKAGEGSYDPFRFNEEISRDEVEFSEDMYIITAATAKEQTEPPRLTTLTVSPAQATVEPGEAQAFTARALDQHGREMALEGIDWSATGGEVGPDGVFRVAEPGGTYVVTASAGGVQARARVTAMTPGTGGTKTPPRLFPERAEGVGRLAWSGSIPPQKWMLFYNKVLAKFVGGDGLRVTINVEVEPSGGLSRQKVEETKVALRELDLEDDVATS